MRKRRLLIVLLVPTIIGLLVGGARATVAVADNGPGIHPEELPHFAEELYRGQQTRQIEGSGLGLALVERIATLHQGELIIRSRVREGTVSSLRLPLGRKSESGLPRDKLATEVGTRDPSGAL